MSGSGSVLHPSREVSSRALGSRHFLSGVGVASSFEHVRLAGGHDSWDSLPGPVSLRLSVVRLGALQVPPAPLSLFDLRAGKVTRQI